MKNHLNRGLSIEIYDSKFNEKKKKKRFYLGFSIYGVFNPLAKYWYDRNAIAYSV